MFVYIIRRILFSLLVVVGVIILTFLLFRVAAGDPASVVLGKNPTPREIEDKRLELGSNKPLFCGWWRYSEVYTAADFTDSRGVGGFELTGDASLEPEGLIVKSGGTLSFNRHFPVDEPVEVCFRFRGGGACAGRRFYSGDWSERFEVFDEAPEKIVFTTDNEFVVGGVVFRRRQESFWDSQLRDSLSELITIKSSFPFVGFLDFGRTLVTRESIGQILWRGVWPSLFLMVPIFIGELLFGVVLALVAAAFKDCWLDRVIAVLSIAGMSVSYLVFIIAGQWMLGYYLGWFPVWGYGGWGYFALPILIGIFCGLGGGVRFYRTVFVNELNKEYLRTAMAKGCGSGAVYAGHLLRNAMVPILARASTVLPFLFTGSLLLESFFGIPGLGWTGVNALMNADLQLVKALVVVSALLFVLTNLLADIAYAWADPRIRTVAE